MGALQEGFPGLTILLTFGHSQLWKETNVGKKPLEACPNGLLGPFLDGMIAAARGKTRLVDGHELSYGYRDPRAFAIAYDVIHHRCASLSGDPAQYRQKVSAGFGLWLDHDWRANGWKTDKVEANYFSPAGLEASLRAAVEQSDEYVWIYTEKPRWWSVRGGPVDLPAAYVESVRRVRKALLDE
jgi:hypothetical protein